jgi:4-amino-4-deoxy-L-arabinose transferase-like glycosyltransferase
VIDLTEETMGQATSSATLDATDGLARDARDARATEVSPALGSARLLAFVDAKRWWLFAFVAVVYLVGFNGVYHPEPDSALYLTLGRNLAEGRGFTYHGQVNSLAYPGYPWLLAGLFKVFGAGSLFAPHAAMLVIALATLAMTYLLFRLHAGRPLAVLVTVNLALTEEMFSHAYQLRNDVPFVLGVVAFLAGYEALARRTQPTPRSGTEPADPVPPPAPRSGARAALAAIGPWVLVLAGLGVAVTMRPTMWALVTAIVLATLWTVAAHRGRVRKRHLAAAAVVVGAVVLFYLLDPRRTGVEGQYEQTVGGLLSAPGATVRRVLNFHVIEAFCTACSEAMFGHELGRGVDWLLMIWCLPAMLAVTYRRPLWFFFLAGNLVILLGLAQLPLPNYPEIVGQLVARHFLGILPLLIYAGWIVAFAAERRLPAKFARWAIPVALAAAFVPNLIKIAETAYRQRAYGAVASRGQSETDGFAELARVLPAHVPPGATVIAPRKQARVVTYYTGLRVVDAAPTLSLASIPGPVYVLDQNEGTVTRLVEREHVRLGPALAVVRGRTEWRGKRVPDWTLRQIVGR